MIDCDIPFSILMMLKNQSGQDSLTPNSSKGNLISNKRDSDISDSSGDEDYRSSSKSLQQLFVGLTEDFSCSICFQLFEKPITLQCNHTYCKGCIDDIINSNIGKSNHQTFSCPLCRAEIRVPSGGIDGFPMNSFLISAIEKMKKANSFCPRFCDHCSSRKVSKKCEACNLFLCKGCCDTIHNNNSNNLLTSSSSSGVNKSQHPIISVNSHLSGDFDLGETYTYREHDLDPAVYIPFNISKSQCTQIFRNWIQSLWFAPSDLKVNLTVRYVKPIYLPYWIFEVHTTTKYGAMISTGATVGTTSLLSQTTIYGSHPKYDMIWSHKINFTSNKHRTAIISNHKLIDKDLLTQVQTWELTNIPSVEQSLPPNPKIQSLAYLVDESTAWKKFAEPKVRTKDREASESKIKASCGSGMAKDIFVETDIIRVASQKVFLPVYFIKYIYDSKSYTVIVNAQNSKIVGHRPYAQGLSTMLRMFK